MPDPLDRSCWQLSQRCGKISPENIEEMKTKIQQSGYKDKTSGAVRLIIELHSHEPPVRGDTDMMQQLHLKSRQSLINLSAICLISTSSPQRNNGMFWERSSERHF